MTHRHTDESRRTTKSDENEVDEDELEELDAGDDSKQNLDSHDETGAVKDKHLYTILIYAAQLEEVAQCQIEQNHGKEWTYEIGEHDRHGLLHSKLIVETTGFASERCTEEHYKRHVSEEGQKEVLLHLLGP